MSGWLLACETSAGPQVRAAASPVAPQAMSATIATSPVAVSPAYGHPAIGPSPVAGTPEDSGRPRPSGPEPLTHAQAAALGQVAEERIFGSVIDHFTVSNEYRHDLWFPFIRDLGGAYVGVASDQNYTLIAAARAEVAYLVDLDRQVIDLHRIYRALIAAAPEPAAFLALFTAQGRKAARLAIKAGLADESTEVRTRALTFYEDQWDTLAAYLGKVHAEQEGSWLADPAAYTYVRAMFAAGRIRFVQGNLLGQTTMPSIAASLDALGLPMRVLYLSNAEEYLFYTERFVANVRALPGAGDSVVLRTIHDRFAGWESCGDGDTRWNYQVQSLTDFKRRLETRTRGLNRDRMLTSALAEGAVERRARGVSVIAPG